MDTPDILVLQASYTNPVHAEAIALVLNHYAEHPMGGGHSLPADLLQQLPAELAKRPMLSACWRLWAVSLPVWSIALKVFPPLPAARWSTSTMWR